MNYIDRIIKEKIIPVIKIDNIEDTIPIMEALQKSGIQIAEITFRTKAADKAIQIATQNYSDMLIGAGTVLFVEQAKLAIDSGVKFIVSPGFSLEVANFCKEKDVLYIPGCITPTEIMRAISCGLEIVKFFPASSYGGLNTIKSLSAVFSNIRFVPTGGINQDNIADYLSFDKIIACGGSWMVKDSLIKEGKFDIIEKLCIQAKEAIK